MKSLCKIFPVVFVAYSLFFLSFEPHVLAVDVRQPASAGSFYPAETSELEQLIDHLTAKAQRTRVQIPAAKSLRALILPHAGFIYSGWTAAHGALVLKPNQYKKVILLGPDHWIGFRNGAISDVTAYRTPLGLVPLHTEAHKLREKSELFRSIPASDSKEHSLEVVLPFLQRYLGDFELIPIVVGLPDTKRFVAQLEPLMDAGTVLVVSSDLSHYLSYSEAVARDRETIDWILSLNSAKLLKSDNRACGVMPVTILLQMARRHHWQPVLLHYSNSGDTAGDRSRVVGYAAIAFFGDNAMQRSADSRQELDFEQGQALVTLARHTIMEKLGREVTALESGTLAETLSDDCFQAHCGTFVTLTINGQLRGCIGNLIAMESIVSGVKRNAINAAFHDPRFAPLKDEELDQLEIEVSILSEPQPLAYNDFSDLLNQLRVNVDGVIIRKGSASATFLPQVWEQLPRPEDFLTHLCMKAGISPDAWKQSKLEVQTYQVQYFEEQK